MSSHQTSYETRLEHARIVLQTATKIKNYKANSPKAKLETLEQLLQKCSAQLEKTKITETIKSNAVAHRMGVIEDNKDGLIPRLVMIKDSLEIDPGKKSLDYKNFMTYYRKIRGYQPIGKSNKPEVKEENPEVEQTETEASETKERKKRKSRRESTFGSKISDFKQVINMLARMKTNYKPEIDLIILDNLKEYHELIYKVYRETEDLKTNYALEQVINKELFDKQTLTAKAIVTKVGMLKGKDSKEYKMLMSLNP